MSCLSRTGACRCVCFFGRYFNGLLALLVAECARDKCCGRARSSGEVVSRLCRSSVRQALLARSLSGEVSVCDCPRVLLIGKSVRRMRLFFGGNYSGLYAPSVPTERQTLRVRNLVR